MAGLIYTANVDGYDALRPVTVRESDIDYLVFTNGDGAKGWRTRKVSMDDSPLLEARKRKVLTPHVVTGYDWYLWLDATMQIKAPVMPLIQALLKSEHDFGAFKHNEWDCAYREIIACVDRNKDTTANLAKAEQLLKQQKFPPNFGQAATGVLFRRNSSKVHAHALSWWLDMQHATLRDQCTFMLNLWQQDSYVEWIPGLHTRNKWFDYRRGHLQ